MSRPLLFLFLLTLGVALALRAPHLALRPMHNDEAVNGIKFGQLWQEGVFNYDPNEHHGPSLFYAAFALGKLTGGPDFGHYSESRLRWVTVLFGLGLVALLPLFFDGLGRRGMAWAALFTAVSPAMVFYSRYFIHEMLLVFFTFLALGAGWRYWRTRKPVWALLTGLAGGLMYATKETFVFTFAAVALALLLNHTWNRRLDASGLPVKAPPLNRLHVVVALAAGLGVGWLLFSSFFTNASGPLDSIRTYQPWLSRAGGESPHIHPGSFYLQRLLWFHPGKGPVWTEALILALALLAGYAGFARRRLGRANASLVRFLFLFTCLLTGIYSVVPYKTPWCLLNFWGGAILLAGVGAAVLLRFFRRRPARWTVAALLLLGASHLAWQAWALGGTYAADQRNPYTYAQTSADVLNLVSKLESLAEVSPQGRQMLVKVMTVEGDCWPLPWYLRRFTQVGWWDSLPPDPFGQAMVVSAGFQAALDDQRTHLMVGYFQLRPQVFLELYVEKELWHNWLEKHPPPPDG